MSLDEKKKSNHTLMILFGLLGLDGSRYVMKPDSPTLMMLSPDQIQDTCWSSTSVPIWNSVASPDSMSQILQDLSPLADNNFLLSGLHDTCYGANKNIH